MYTNKFQYQTNSFVHAFDRIKNDLISYFLRIFMPFKAYKSKPFGFSTFIRHYFHT